MRLGRNPWRQSRRLQPGLAPPPPCRGPASVSPLDCRASGGRLATDPGGHRGRTSTTMQAGRRRRQARATFVLAGRALDVPQAAVRSGRQRSTAVSCRGPWPASSPDDEQPDTASQARGARALGAASGPRTRRIQRSVADSHGQPRRRSTCSSPGSATAWTSLTTTRSPIIPPAAPRPVEVHSLARNRQKPRISKTSELRRLNDSPLASRRIGSGTAAWLGEGVIALDR
jgi:hypothetical protein